MKSVPILAAITLLMLPASNAFADDEIALDRLNLGTYWYGARISKKDLLGKVVLVEIYGS